MISPHTVFEIVRRPCSDDLATLRAVEDMYRTVIVTIIRIG